MSCLCPSMLDLTLKESSGYLWPRVNHQAIKERTAPAACADRSRKMQKQTCQATLHPVCQQLNHRNEGCIKTQRAGSGRFLQRVGCVEAPGGCAQERPALQCLIPAPPASVVPFSVRMNKGSWLRGGTGVVQKQNILGLLTEMGRRFWFSRKK